MKKQRIKNRFNKLLLASMVGCSFPLFAQVILSCESKSNNFSNQTWIDQKYQDFQEAKSLIDPSNIFIEYFANNPDLLLDKEFVIPFDVIDKVFDIEKIANIEQEFIGKYDSSNNKLSITYKMKQGNKELISSKLNNVKVFEVKKFTNEQKTDLNTILTSWKEFVVKIQGAVKNTNETPKEILLDNLDEIKFINPLFLVGAFDNEQNEFFSKSLTEFKNQQSVSTITQKNSWKIGFKLFFSLDGEISIELKLFNNLHPSDMEFILGLEKQKKYSGFMTNEASKTNIENIYKDLGLSYNLKTLNANQTYPQIASSVYDLSTLGILLNNIQTKVNDVNKFKLPEYFDSKTQHNSLWYELQISTINANDISGILNVNFTVKDKFSGLSITPQNISRIMTLTNFYPLVIKDPNDSAKDDYSILENVYQAYTLFSKLNLKNKYLKLPSSSPQEVVNFNWLNTNTDISLLIKNFNPTDGSFEISSPLPNQDPQNPNTSLRRTTKFRIKANSISNTKEINDDINGFKSIPFLLEMEVKFDDKTANTWATVLPQNKVPNSTSSNQFNSKAEEVAYIKIGGYRTKDLDIAGKIYAIFKSESSSAFAPINVSVSENIFNTLIQSNQKDGIQSIKELVSLEIRKKLETSQDVEIKNQVNDIFKKFNFSFDLFNVWFNSTAFDTNNKPTNLETNIVDFVITSKNDENAKFQYYDPTIGHTNYPKVKIVITKTYQI